MLSMSSATAIVPYVTPKTSMAIVEEENLSSLRIPNVLIVHIFSFFDESTLAQCSIVAHNWNQLSDDKGLWDNIFKKNSLSEIKTENSGIHDVWRFRDLIMNFGRSNRFGAAMAACKKCIELEVLTGAYGFRDLCKEACRVNNYVIAAGCQQQAEQHYSSAGNEAMRDLIKSRVSDSDFLEMSTELIKSSRALTYKDREFGLEALMSIAKQFANLQMFKEAIKYTRLGKALRDSLDCNRGRNFDYDIYPFREMGKHMLSLKQYKLAEECAEELGEYREYFYADIISKQMQEENSLNTSLMAKLKPQTPPWIKAQEGLVFGLCDNGRWEEARMMAKSLLLLDSGNYKFKRELKKKLLTLGIDINLWFGQQFRA